MQNILVTDGENRSSLAVVRSLGKKGCRILVTAGQKRSLASSSKYCDKSISVPNPMKNGNEYAQILKKIVGKEGIDVVFPMSDSSIFLLNEIRDQFPEKVIIACSTADKMEAVSNKFKLFQLAEKLKLPTPCTHYLTGQDDLPALVREIDKYPVVVKPAMSRIVHGNGFLSGGVKYASSREELESLYKTSPVLEYPSMIQEKIVGPGTGLFTLFNRDRHLALFSHRRIREKPPSGGVSVVSESVPLDEEMIENASRLLSATAWQGVAMVEFKRDNRDGKAKLMEINGRFWGSLQLAISCGVDFPGLFLDLLMGKKMTQVKEYRTGHKMKWFFGTLDHLYIRLKNNDETLNLPSGSPTKFRAFLDFMKIWEKDAFFDVFDRNDIGPFLFEARNYFRLEKFFPRQSIT